MRLLHVVPSYLPATRYGGPIHSVHGLCRALAARGHDVHVFTTNVDGPGDSDVPLGQAVELDGVKVWYFPSSIGRRLFYAPAMNRALVRLVGDFDVVHLHSVFLWPTLAAARSARAAGIPYVLAPRGMLNRSLIARRSTFAKSAWIRFFERTNIECAACLHATSALEVQELESLGFRMPPIACVPNGIDLSELICAGERVGEDQDFVLFLGRVHWKKGLDLLLRAWQFVPAWRLIIAGNDEEAYRPILERLAGQLGVADRVTFSGPVCGDEKWRLLGAAALFVLPSSSENFGIAVLEAMAAGCPVAVTPAVGLASSVLSSECGIVIDGSPEEMGNMIASILADQPRRLAMGQRGRETAKQLFSWPVVAMQMEQTYLGVLARRDAAARAVVS